jgi:hypothetical protein
MGSTGTADLPVSGTLVDAACAWARAGRGSADVTTEVEIVENNEERGQECFFSEGAGNW